MADGLTTQDAIRAAVWGKDSSLSVIATDISGTILYWNSPAEELYGWRASEVLGRNIVDVTPSAMSRREAEEIMQLLVKGKRWSGNFTVRHRDGTPFQVHVDDEPVMHDGTVVGIVGVSRRSGRISSPGIAP